MDAGIAQVIAATVIAVPPTIVALVSLRTVRDTHRQVETLNESTLGQLAAETETRRVKAMGHDARTAREQRHVDEAPPTDPPQGPGR